MAVIDDWLSWLHDALTYISLIFTLSILIFFIYHFYKKTKNICSVYFYILFCGFFWDICCTFAELGNLVCDELTKRKKYKYDVCYWPAIMEQTLLWYFLSFTAIWTLILSINRLTAIVWWQKYDQIWAPKLWPVLILMSAYPFLLNGYSFINYKCRFELRDCKPKEYERYWQEDANVTSIGNGVIAGLSLLVAIITAVIYRWKSKTDGAFKSRPDRKLVFQAIISSFTYVLWCILYAVIEMWGTKVGNGKTKIGVGFLILVLFKDLSWHVYHLSHFILVFVFS